MQVNVLFDIAKQPHGMKLRKCSCTSIAFFTDSCLSLSRQYEASIELIDVNQSSCNTETAQHSCLLDISRQLKLGSRGNISLCSNCWVHTSQLLGYLVHTCHLAIANILQYPNRTAFALQGIRATYICSAHAVQPLHNYNYYTYVYTY